MGQRYTELGETLSAFIRQQHLFFVGTAGSDNETATNRPSRRVDDFE